MHSVELLELHRPEQQQPALPQQHPAAQGGELRHQPQRDGAALGRLRRAGRTTRSCRRASPGFRNANLYPSRPNLARARTLARGATRNGSGVFFYSLTPPGPQRMELMRANLRAIGINIEPRGFRGFAIYDAAGARTSDHASSRAAGARTTRTRTTS